MIPWCSIVFQYCVVLTSRPSGTFSHHLLIGSISHSSRRITFFFFPSGCEAPLNRDALLRARFRPAANPRRADDAGVDADDFLAPFGVSFPDVFVCRSFLALPFLALLSF